AAEDRLLEDAERGGLEQHDARARRRRRRDAKAEAAARRADGDSRQRQHRRAARAGRPDRRIPARRLPADPRRRRQHVRRCREDRRPQAEVVADVPQRNRLPRLRARMSGEERSRKGRLAVQGDTATLVFERILEHTPEHVWDAIATPAGLKGWLMFTEARIYGRAGGTLELRSGRPSIGRRARSWTGI